MRAILLSAFGPPDALVATDLPDPLPGAGQALIEVEFASITFVETQIRAGKPPNPYTTKITPTVVADPRTTAMAYLIRALKFA